MTRAAVQYVEIGPVLSETDARTEAFLRGELVRLQREYEDRVRPLKEQLVDIYANYPPRWMLAPIPPKPQPCVLNDAAPDCNELNCRCY